jgi:thiol-disulfide isomerase/thioredoxin
VPQKEAGDLTFNNEFSLVLKDYSGNDVHLYEFRRQVLVAYAWASWCTYCGDEMQHLAQLKKTYGDKIQILAINRAEPLATAKDFTDKLKTGTDITLLLDPNDAFFKSISGYAMPETVFIDASGNIAYHQRGPIDMPTLEAKMKELVH